MSLLSFPIVNICVSIRYIRFSSAAGAATPVAVRQIEHLGAVKLDNRVDASLVQQPGSWSPGPISGRLASRSAPKAQQMTSSVPTWVLSAQTPYIRNDAVAIIRNQNQLGKKITMADNGIASNRSALKDFLASIATMSGDLSNTTGVTPYSRASTSQSMLTFQLHPSSWLRTPLLRFLSIGAIMHTYLFGKP